MSNIRARDIETHIRHRGFEKGTVYLLTALAEQMAEIRRDQTELAVFLDKIINIVGNFSAVAENMKSAVESINKSMKHEELGVSTQSIEPDEPMQ